MHPIPVAKNIVKHPSIKSKQTKNAEISISIEGFYEVLKGGAQSLR